VRAVPSEGLLYSFDTEGGTERGGAGHHTKRPPRWA
jgi:hypothetical protein